jgi:hypothetical protein
MIVLREKTYSQKAMIARITEKLDKEKIEEYEVSDRVPKDSISVIGDLMNFAIYLPQEFEYTQYSLDDKIRSLAPHIRTNTVLDRNVYVMRLSAKLTEDQLYKLIKWIIAETDFCVILDL